MLFGFPIARPLDGRSLRGPPPPFLALSALSASEDSERGQCPGPHTQLFGLRLRPCDGGARRMGGGQSRAARSQTRHRGPRCWDPGPPLPVGPRARAETRTRNPRNAAAALSAGGPALRVPVTAGLALAEACICLSLRFRVQEVVPRPELGLAERLARGPGRRRAHWPTRPRPKTETETRRVKP